MKGKEKQSLNLPPKAIADLDNSPCNRVLGFFPSAGDFIFTSLIVLSLDRQHHKRFIHICAELSCCPTKLSAGPSATCIPASYATDHRAAEPPATLDAEPVYP